MRKLMLVLLGALLAMSGITMLAGLPGAGNTPPVHAAVQVTPMASTVSSGINGGNLTNSLLSPLIGFFHSILNSAEDLISTIFGGIGQSIAQIFSGWGYSVTGTAGVFAPIVMVAILGATGMIAYLFIDAYGAEKDVAGAEADL